MHSAIIILHLPVNVSKLLTFFALNLSNTLFKIPPMSSKEAPSKNPTNAPISAASDNIEYNCIPLSF